jgi:hypothetical protein
VALKWEAAQPNSSSPVHTDEFVAWPLRRDAAARRFEIGQASAAADTCRDNDSVGRGRFCRRLHRPAGSRAAASACRTARSRRAGACSRAGTRALACNAARGRRLAGEEVGKALLALLAQPREKLAPEQHAGIAWHSCQLLSQ